ncbi:MAG TPA: cytochrome c oxidase assembly protein, partial [Thermomicrobiales bacterium]|nr:cytochrome c oxidase assembly protein [Thermomicrobiales bacterium]
GYLFAWSIAGPDPAPGRPGLTTRLAVLVTSIAAHAYLGKTMYAHLFPRGTHYSADEIEAAAELMYYGGDLAELLLAAALFATWYQQRRRTRERDLARGVKRNGHPLAPAPKAS